MLPLLSILLATHHRSFATAFVKDQRNVTVQQWNSFKPGITESEIMSNPQEKIVLRRKFSFGHTPSFGVMTESTLPNLVEVGLEQADLTPAEASDLQRDPEVVAIADPMPLKLIEPFESTGPTPAANGNTWGVEAVRADTSPFDGTGIVVAVLDTGISPGHVAFQGVTLERRNFTNGSDDDEHGHGTHCAGTIFGRNVNGLRIGVARGVNKALIGKVLGPGGGSSADLANAINWAYEKGANVISMSLESIFPVSSNSWLTTGGSISGLPHRLLLSSTAPTSICSVACLRCLHNQMLSARPP